MHFKGIHGIVTKRKRMFFITVSLHFLKKICFYPTVQIIKYQNSATLVAFENYNSRNMIRENTGCASHSFFVATCTRKR